MDFLERFGVSTAMLMAVVYFGFTLIIEPLVKSYREAVHEVAISAKALEKSVDENGRIGVAAQQKMDATMKALEENREIKSQIERNILQAVHALEAKVDAALSRMEK